MIYCDYFVYSQVIYVAFLIERFRNAYIFYKGLRNVKHYLFSY